MPTQAPTWLLDGLALLVLCGTSDGAAHLHTRQPTHSACNNRLLTQVGTEFPTLFLLTVCFAATMSRWESASVHFFIAVDVNV